jgi:hypothetical protein
MLNELSLKSRVLCHRQRGAAQLSIWTIEQHICHARNSLQTAPAQQLPHCSAHHNSYENLCVGVLPALCAQPASVKKTMEAVF